MTIDTQDKFYTLEKTYPVSMAMYDLQYRLKPSALLDLLQDMGARNIKGTPFGNVELNAQNLGWFLVRYRIEFDNYPKELTEINPTLALNNKRIEISEPKKTRQSTEEEMVVVQYQRLIDMLSTICKQTEHT